ncbi:MAG: AsmA family protein [Rubrivivax sp.]|nr:MAG: AsmA family protein [Rubrivivax sp.]
MTSWIRRLAWALGAVVLLLVGVGGYLLATFDPNRYQGLLTDWVREHKQRTLVIGAPMELKLFPQLRLKLTKVTLSEHQQPAEFLAVDAAELSLDLPALFKRQLVIDRISAQGVRLAYRRDAEGRSNIDDLLKKDDKPPEPGTPSEALTFDVAAIQLEQVSAKVDDAKSGIAGSLAIHRLSSGHLADGVPSDIKLDAAFELSKPQVAKGGVKGEFRITPHLGGAPSAEFDRIKVAVRGDVPGVKALQAELTGAAAWDGEHQSVKAQSLAIEVSGQVGGQAAAPAWVVDRGRVAVDSFSYDPGQQWLALVKLVVAVKAQQGGRAVTLDLDWPELDVKGDRLKGSPLTGKLKVTGPIEVAAAFASQAPTGGFSAIKVPGVKLDFSATMAGAGGQRQVKGQLLTDVAARPRESAGALEALRLQASIQEPSLQPLQVQLNGRAGLAGDAAQWRLTGQLNDNPFASEGSLELGGNVPRVQASAHFTSLDLNRLLPVPVAGIAAPPGAKAGVEAPDAPVDMSALKSIDGQFKFKADKLAVRQYRLTEADLAATLQAGHLTVSRLAAGAWGGQVLAHGAADAGGSQSLALQAQAEGIDILAMLKDVAGKDMLEGTGQVKLDVKTGGAKVSQLIAGLNGDASLRLRDGAVRGINLAKSLRDVKAQLSGKSDAVQKSSQAEKTDFTELAGTFQIRNGVAHNEDLSAKSPFLRVGGKGDINLVQRRLNYTVSATVTGTVTGQDGAEAAALNGLTVPVRLSGPFDAPDWKIAWSEVAVGAIQNTVKSKLQEQLKDPVQQQKLKDKLLKGLFK